MAGEELEPRVRKFALTLHVIVSVGWLGATLAFLALAINGITSADMVRVRGGALAMQTLALFVIVPLSLASLATGLVQALGTKWGLFRHHWIVAKLVINVVSSLVLLVHTQPINALARAASEGPVTSAHFALQLQLVVAAAAASVALMVAVTLAVVKPRGLTSYGRRKQLEAQAGTEGP